MTDLPHRPASPRSPAEPFKATGRSLPFALGDFWRWQGSDLLSNAQRGILAEFIVAQALGSTTPVREEWSAFDVTTADGITVEVKSSAYLQSWAQRRPSEIRFTIRPTRQWDYEKWAWADEVQRQAAVYVFCVFAARDKATAYPLDLDQWEFYVLPTRVLNEKAAGQSGIGLNALLRLGPAKASYATLRAAVASAAG
jgi:hypothetical protein